MAWFATTPGFVDCGKCGGWQILDKTKRRANGWPVGPIVIENCDHCSGKGELPDPNYKAPVNPWAAIKPAPAPAPIPAHNMPIWDIDDPAPPVEIQATSEPRPPIVTGPWGAPPEEPKGWADYGK